MKTKTSLLHDQTTGSTVCPSVRTIGAAIRWMLPICVCGVLAGCSTTDTSIVSKPPGALVTIDGANIGRAPVRHKFDFNQTPKTVLTASKEGYFDQQLTLTRNSDLIRNNQLEINLAEDEAYKFTSSSDAANNWLRVQVDPSLQPDVVWQKMVDSVTSHFPSLEMIDATSGYMRSVYTIKKFKAPKGEYQIRTRFICSISSKSPLVYKMKVESEQSTANQDWIPYNRIFKEDAQLIEELQGRLGVK